MKSRKPARVFKDIKLYCGIAVVFVAFFNLFHMAGSFFDILFGFVFLLIAGLGSVALALFKIPGKQY